MNRQSYLTANPIITRFQPPKAVVAGLPPLARMRQIIVETKSLFQLCRNSSLREHQTLWRLVCDFIIANVRANCKT